MTERILTVADVATFLQVPENTVRLWLREKKIPGRRIGKRWLIVEADLVDSLRVPAVLAVIRSQPEDPHNA